MRKVRLYFPMKGQDTNYAATAQPPFTSPRLRNVRPYDVLERRARGGQRPGLRRMYEQVLGVYPDLSAYTSLQAWWRMEELDPAAGADTVKDSVGTNHGDPNEALTSIEGSVGRAIRFDGDSQFIDCGASDGFGLAGPGFTINAWLRPSSVDLQALLSWYVDASHYVLFQQWALGLVTLNINGTSLMSTQYVPYTDFRMVTAVYDGAQIRMYTNGVLTCTPTDYAGGFSTGAAANILIGKFIAGTELWLAADVNNVMLFNEALTAEQIADLYANLGSPIVAMGQVTTVKG